MLPITANPPREFSVLTDSDVEHIRSLLKPNTRRHADALAFLRTLVLSDRVAQDQCLAARCQARAGILSIY